MALVGGPLMRRHYALFDRLEAGGAKVVLDATTTGERTLAAPFDRRLMADDPFAALVEAYFGHIPDAFRRPNSELYRWLKTEFEARGVRGIVFHHYVWCDTWHAEAQRLQEWARRPFLHLVSGDEHHLNGHTEARIQAFLEMLR